MFFIDSCNFFVLRNTPSSSSFYEISCKISETWKIFPILHSAPRDSECLFTNEVDVGSNFIIVKKLKFVELILSIFNSLNKEICGVILAKTI